LGKKPHHETTDHHKFTLGKVYDRRGVIGDIETYSNQGIHSPDSKAREKKLQEDCKQSVIFSEDN